MDREDSKLTQTQAPVSIKELETVDASLLISARFFDGTKKEVRAHIESVIKNVGKGNAYLLSGIGSQEGITGLCGFSSVYPATNQSTVWIQRKEDADFAIGSKALSFLLYEGFHRRKFHKLSLSVKANDHRMIELMESGQWKKEGVFRDHYLEKGTYCDGIRYAMIDSDFFLLCTSLVPFLSGYLAVQATFESVFWISILKEGEAIPDFISGNCEIKNRISEKNRIKTPGGSLEVLASSHTYPYLNSCAYQLFEYTQGLRTEFDMSYEFSGATAFQKQVWNATLQIPYGQTRTYEEVAQKLKPKEKETNLSLMARAVGTALSKNAIMIAIPCHRVIGKDGKLKGFAGGLEVKDHLLSHEMLSLRGKRL